MISTFIAAHWLDIVTTILGLAYILLEYKASAWMWLAGFLMQALGIVLYYQKGLYADCGMEFYYLLVTIYGVGCWVLGDKRWWKHKDKPSAELSISHFPRRLVVPWITVILCIWGIIYWLLVTFTNSNVNRYLGIGTQVSGTMVHLDCCRCGYLRPVFLQGHSLQGIPLCTLRGDCRIGISQVEANDE